MSNNISSLSPTHGYAALYNFPKSLSLSGDSAIEYILADIPIFSVGLLSFGVFTFFVTMKRVSSLSVVLYLTVFFAFIASIFDLSQILARGRSNTDIGKGLNAVAGLITAREIFYAASVGLRFLFFWLFVAEPPRGEIVKHTPFDPFANLFVEEMHSGAWGRWGIPGLILKWTLLAVTFTIGLLQLIWRIVPSANMFGPVYGADAAMEIVVSALFVIKLLLNTLITPITPRSKTLRRYATMIFALVINLGLGVGNIVIFAFTESTLGRFLLAIEIYIIVVFVLISSFYNYVPKPTDTKGPPTFEGVPEIKRSSTFRIPPADNAALVNNPVIDNPAMPIDTSNGNYPITDSRPERPSRSSTASRLSSWIVSRRMSRRRSVGSGDRAQLWNQDQAEQGESPVERVVIDGQESSYSSPIGLPNETQNWGGSSRTATMNNLQLNPGERSMSRWTATTVSTSDSPYAKNASNNDSDSAPLKRPPMPLLESKVYSIGSYYADGPDKPVPSIPTATSVRQTESPVYGLGGIVQRPSQGRQTPSSITRTRSSAMSFTDLLRQQTELDDSIAALRLLSPQQPGQDSGEPMDPMDGVTNSKAPKDLNRSNSSVGVPSSGRSEFSLSNFPEPPMTFTSTANGIPSPTSTSRDRFDRNEERRSVAAGLLLPKMPILSEYPTTPMPDSPGQSSEDAGNRPGNMSRMKVDSAGTQYDVTSFIGNLTTPESKKGPAFDKLTDIASEDGRSEFTASENTPRATMIMQMPNLLAPTIRPLDVKRGSVSRPRTSKPTHKRMTSSNILPSLSIGNSPGSQSNPPQYLSTGSNIVGAAEEAEVSARRRGPGLPVRPRLTISGPKAPPRDGKGDQAPSAFERPRPPPLILQQRNGN